MLTLRVYGTPASKGSGRAVLRGGRALYLSGGSKQQQEQQQSWDAAVRDAVRVARNAAPFAMIETGPVRVAGVFLVARPSAHRRRDGSVKDTAPYWCSNGKDLDKMVRATLDPLEAAGVLRNDSQVSLLVASKKYADSGEAPGATVLVLAPEAVR